MAKIKLTKGELKRQRDSLKQFRHYLPTLQLKKQQLQMKILEAKRMLSDRKWKLDEKVSAIEQWAGLFAEDGKNGVDFKKWIKLRQIITEDVNIAGARTRIFKDVIFDIIEYDFYSTPLWIDRALDILKEMACFQIQVKIIQEQISVLQKELRITTQRVNLFEKIKIPECLENIRRIRIYLGDQQANAVGIGKVAKKKIAEKEMELALV